jgi:hypothetical protein
MQPTGTGRATWHRNNELATGKHTAAHPYEWSEPRFVSPGLRYQVLVQRRTRHPLIGYSGHHRGCLPSRRVGRTPTAADFATAWVM